MNKHSNKRPKLNHQPSTPLSPSINTLKSNEQTNRLPQLPPTQQIRFLPSIQPTQQLDDLTPFLSSPQINRLQPLKSAQTTSNAPLLLQTQQLNKIPSSVTARQTKKLLPLLSTQPPNNLPPLLSTQHVSNLPPLLQTQQSGNLAPLLSTQQSDNLPPLLSTQQINNLSPSLSTQQSDNLAYLLTNQQSEKVPSLLLNQQIPLKSTELTNSVSQSNHLEFNFSCGVCLESVLKLYPDCYQCLSKKENTLSHEFCMNCIVKTNKCPLCKASVTPLYHYMALLKMKSECNKDNLNKKFQSCLWKLLKETITSISIYPEIRSICEEIIKHCVSNIKGSDNMAFELVLENYNILSIELIDYLIHKFGIKESYSDYIIIMIKQCFSVNTKKSSFDFRPIIAIVQKYGNVSDYSNYNGQAIKSALQWKIPNLYAVTNFIFLVGNQPSDHEFFHKKAVEVCIRSLNMKGFNHLMRHFQLDKNPTWMRSTILDVLSYSFDMRNFKLIEPMIVNYGKEDDIIEYLILVVVYMIKYSITTQTCELIDHFAKKSDLPILINHAINLSIEASKFDVLNFIIGRYGIRGSYKVHIDLAIHASVLYSQFNIIQNIIQNFGNQDEYNDYFETAITSCLYYSNFKLISQYRINYGIRMSDEAFISKTIELGIKSDFYQGLKVFIKEYGKPLHYLDYISLLESFKGTGKDEIIDDFITSFYFNEQ